MNKIKEYEKRNPEAVIKETERERNRLNRLELFTGGNKEIAEAIQQAQSTEEQLDKYTNSGAFDQYMADNRRIESANIEDEELEAVIYSKSLLQAKYVEKNNSGISKNKSVKVQIVTKKGDTCYLMYGNLFQTYEGEGYYGAAYFSYRSASRHRINYDNRKIFLI